MNLKVCSHADFFKTQVLYTLKRKEGNSKKMNVKPSMSNVIQAVPESREKSCFSVADLM